MVDNYIFHHMIEDSPVGYVCHEIIYSEDKEPKDYVFRYLNPAFQHLTGFQRVKLEGLKLSSFLASIGSGDNSPWFTLFKRTVVSKSHQEDINFIEPLNKWIQTQTFIIDGRYLIALYADITSHINATKELENQNRFLNTLISNLPGIVFRSAIDKDLTFEYIQGLCHEITGYLPEELLGNKETKFIGLIPPKHRKRVLLKWKSSIANRHMFQDEYPIVAKDGTKKWISEQGVAIYNQQDEAIAIEGIITDITERKLSELALNKEKELLRITLQSIGDGVITTDRTGKITMINRMAEQITHWPQQHCIGLDFEKVFNVYDERTHQKIESPIKRVLNAKKTFKFHQGTYLIAKDGSRPLIAYNAAPIKDKDSQIHGIIVVFRDITSSRMLEDKVRFINYHDPLTQLYNRSYFTDRLVQANSGNLLPISLLMGDVNGLKLCNDVFGHETGDTLLRTISNVMQKCIREKDILARWGGDEFIIFMPNTPLKVAEEIRQKIYNECKATKSAPIELSISMGAATKTRINDNIFDILKEAEDNMYSNKLVESKEFRDSIIKSLKETLFTNTNETEEHTKRVSKIAEAIGMRMGMSQRRLEELRLLAVLHDIGKIAVGEQASDEFYRGGPEDYSDIRKHPEIGYRIAQTTPELIQIAEGILAHHERWDGQGYPRGLQGLAIPLMARIISIADRYDSVTNPKSPELPKLSHAEALENIKNNAGKRFDPNIVAVFLDLVDQLK